MSDVDIMEDAFRQQALDESRRSFGDPEEESEDRPAPGQPGEKELPSSPLSGKRTLVVRADEAEFRRWFQANIGDTIEEFGA